MDFSPTEYQTRCSNTQKLMHQQNIDALFLTREAEIRYFSGFRTPFWQSPTRPWFLIIPQTGDPIAIIPEIGRALMTKNWVSDIRTWSAPNPDDDGISLLVDALKPYQKIGTLKGNETYLRMPLANFERLTQTLSCEWVDCTPIIQKIRGVKSSAEIMIIKEICQIASDVFDDVPNFVHEGQSLKQAFKQFKIAMLNGGADDVPYLVGGADSPSYNDIIGPPSDEKLKKGDVFMFDTGSTLKGYFCDFDRNYAIGKADDTALYAYEKLWHATEAGLEAVRPGMKAAQLFDAMNNILDGDGDADNDTVGRFGHGLGIELTEWPSFYPKDDTILEENMVITLEPSIMLPDGSIMVTEENLVIQNGTPLLLSKRAPKTLPIIG